eukprot:Nitzschia sp. Nitz4//scaffold20_size174350//110936//113779//NITZ4_002113-RA/size174350-processed-gene-0.62-mRNA-1//1//CDS//3329541842//7728//frame0
MDRSFGDLDASIGAEVHEAVFSVVNAQNDDCLDSSSEGENSFSFADTMKLRRNLTASFDKVEADSFRKATLSEAGSVSSSVSSRIAMFEASAAPKSRPPLPRVNTVPSNRLAVYLRIRPISKNKGQSTIQVLKAQPPNIHPTTIRTIPPPDSNVSKNHRGPQVSETLSTVKEFEFHQVLTPDTKQQTVYNTVASPLIQGVLDETLLKQPTQTADPTQQHASALLFSYGITNAGKTHTILGDIKKPAVKDMAENQGWGIVPRAIADVFERLQNLPKTTTTNYDLQLSLFEIYKEQVFDLLPRKQKQPLAMPEPLKVRERHGQTIVRGLVKHKVRDVAHGIELVMAANHRRHTASNRLNSGSSRSHCVCQLQLVPKASQMAIAKANAKVSVGSSSICNQADDDASVSSMAGYTTDEEASLLFNRRTATVWIVDLAGSERAKRTGEAGIARQKEAAQINKSLMTLMRCLTILRESKPSSSSNVVPFRESKLTHVFMGHMTGPSAARTAIVVNVNPIASDFDESQHVLSYASQAKFIQLDLTELTKSGANASKGKSDTAGSQRHTGAFEYGLDGRRKPIRAALPPAGDKRKAASPMRKLLKKLSPKRMVNLWNKKGTSDKRTKEKAFESDSKAGPNPERAQKRTKTEHQDVAPRALPEPVKIPEVDELRSKLGAAEAEILMLTERNQQLEVDLENQETQIRMEVSEEMEKRLKVARERNQEEMARLKAQLTQSNGLSLGGGEDMDFPLTTRKALMDEAERHIEELMDKVDECEAEMVRMRQDHELELEEQNTTHFNELQQYKTKIEEQEMKNTELELSLEGARLELAGMKAQVQELEQSNSHRPAPTHDDDASSGDGDASDEEDEDDGNEEDENEDIPLWKQKLLRKRNPERMALRNVSNSQTTQNEQQWIFPKKATSQDESNGLYRRPLGRAPVGREWDAEVGAWKLANA